MVGVVIDGWARQGNVMDECSCCVDVDDENNNNVCSDMKVI